MNSTKFGPDPIFSLIPKELINPKIKYIKPRAPLKAFAPNLYLLQAFNNRFKNEKYPLIFAWVMKTRYLIREYNSLARKLKKYPAGKKSVNDYLEIVYKAEITLLIAGQLIEVFNSTVKEIGKQYHDGKMTSPGKRIDCLHNKVKHGYKHPDLYKKILIIHLDESGIYSGRIRITYNELREFIQNFLSVQEKIYQG